MMHGHKGAQAAIDFLMSYGVALLVMGMAISIIYRLTLVSPLITASSCAPTPSFSCNFASLSANGMLTLQLSQSTGGTITVRGVACSSQANVTGNKPAYGNIYVTNAISYYPSGATPGAGVTLYSDSNAQFTLYCYSQSGIAVTNLGASFFGFVWINYTIPGFTNVTQQVVSLTQRSSK